MTMLIFLAIFTQSPTPQAVSVTVDGLPRIALIYESQTASTRPEKRPVVFVFHGHNGNETQAALKYDIQDSWADAIVVYPQGLVTDSPLVGRGTGWQHAFGESGDRDIKFVDALADYVNSKYTVNQKRFYACGMSNGAQFSLLLLSARPRLFSAFASVSGAGGAFSLRARTPKPVLLINGTQDTLVKFSAAEKTRNFYLRLNGCAMTPSESHGYDLYSSPVGADVGWHQFDGGHQWPSFATEEVVRFFKSH
jgi:polyhydroxybutyrate depolymerase